MKKQVIGWKVVWDDDQDDLAYCRYASEAEARDSHARNGGRIVRVIRWRVTREELEAAVAAYRDSPGTWGTAMRAALVVLGIEVES